MAKLNANRDYKQHCPVSFPAPRSLHFKDTFSKLKKFELMENDSNPFYIDNDNALRRPIGQQWKPMKISRTKWQQGHAGHKKYVTSAHSRAEGMYAGGKRMILLLGVMTVDTWIEDVAELDENYVTNWDQCAQQFL
ncbi:unnamed protein product [Hermetia illucens]|uniref:Uncharacterized protein n=1 Tax=Hermetia illucens TaxID=343691 RepID=A0A7R8YSG4_HERIL|nr:unnamed protein product [Hermetia illucens]